MSTKISVIVPIYRVEAYIHRCIDSLINQTFTDIEIILIDDGSDDNCPKICDDYSHKDSRIKVLHQKNSGVSIARNIGIEKCTGKYISFVDGDDWLEINALETAYNIAESYKGNIVVCYKVLCENSSFKYTNYKTEGLMSIENFTAFSSEETAVWNKLFSSNLIKNNNIKFQPKISLSEDSTFNLKCCLLADFIIGLNDYFYHYWTRSDSAVHNLTKKNIIDNKASIEELEIFAENVEKKSLIENIIIERKIRVKKGFLYRIKHPDTKLFVKTFPEVDDLTIERLKKESRIFYISVLLAYKRVYFLANYMAIMARTYTRIKIFLTQHRWHTF